MQGGEKDVCATTGQSLSTDENDGEENDMAAVATRDDGDDPDEEDAEEAVALERYLFAAVDRTIEINARWSRILISRFSDMQRGQFGDSSQGEHALQCLRIQE
jgi:hypothetical protein